MVFPSQSINVIDPGIGFSPAVANIPLITGQAFGGSASSNEIISIGALDQVRTVLGYGPLAEDVALALQKNGGPVYAVIHDNDDSGATLVDEGMTPSGEGSAIDVSGTPNDAYSLRVEIITTGSTGEGRFRYTLDAHDANVAPATWSQIRTIPMSGEFPIAGSGLTLNFEEGDAGEYVAGDIYSLDTVPPAVLATDLADVALELLGKTSFNFHLWLLSGMHGDEVAAASLAAAFGGHLVSLTNTFRFARGICDIGDGSVTDTLDEAETWTNARVCPVYGEDIRASALPFEGFAWRKCSKSAGVGARAIGDLISTDLSRFASGPDEGVRKISFDADSDQRLDEAKISTARTWPGVAGFYFSNGKLKSPFGSDFTDLQYGRIMDVACRVTFEAQLPMISEGWRANTDGSGTIDPRDAATIEETVTSALRDAIMRPNNARGLPGHASAVVYTVDKLHNIVTTSQLKTSVGIVPLGYSKQFLTDLFFTLEA